MTAPSTYPCPAKVNLALSVGAPRDDGFHPLCSWMVTVSLADELTVTPLQAGPSTFEIDWADDALQKSLIDWPVEKDLAYRAHALMQEHVGRELPVAVSLRKRIPVGAGLGGGSSDGAAMLLALNDLYNLHVPMDELRQLAGKLGSDVAFFVEGKSAIITGIGEMCEPIALPETLHLVLILPPLQCNTAAVYRRFDEMSPGVSVNDEDIRAMCSATLLMDDELFNDLDEAAISVEPKLLDVRNASQVAAARRVHITGSGAAMFALCRNADEARSLATEIHHRAHVPAIAVHTL